MREISADVAPKRVNESGASTQAGRARIESASLFQGKSEIIIVHRNEEYNLRITRHGKLILTK